MDNLSQHVAIRLKVARKVAGYKKAKDFAKAYEIPLSTYSQHETGKRLLNVELLVKYAEMFKVNSSWLLTGKGHPIPSTLSDAKRKIAIDNEIESLRKEGKLPVEEFPNIAIDAPDAIVDMKLFKEILVEVMPLLMDMNISFDYDEIFNFCVDIYNNIICIPDEKSNRKSLIQLSIRSLTKGLEQSYSQEKKKTKTVAS